MAGGGERVGKGRKTYEKKITPNLISLFQPTIKRKCQLKKEQKFNSDTLNTKINNKFIFIFLWMLLRLV